MSPSKWKWTGASRRKALSMTSWKRCQWRTENYRLATVGQEGGVEDAVGVLCGASVIDGCVGLLQVCVLPAV